MFGWLVTYNVKQPASWLFLFVPVHSLDRSRRADNFWTTAHQTHHIPVQCLFQVCVHVRDAVPVKGPLEQGRKTKISIAGMHRSMCAWSAFYRGYPVCTALGELFSSTSPGLKITKTKSETTTWFLDPKPFTNDEDVVLLRWVSHQKSAQWPNICCSPILPSWKSPAF